MGQLPLDDCERIRGYAAWSVDGELSEVEAAALAAHRARCSACNAYAARLEEAARLVRETPLKRLDFPIVLPSRRLRFARTVQIGAAAAAVAAVVGVSVTVPFNAPAHRSAAGTVRAVYLTPEDELRMLREASTVRDTSAHARLAR
jgi:ferric-dicitrate binding protein FerR (iron transport regulator)